MQAGLPWFWTTVLPLANPTFAAALLVCVAAWLEHGVHKTAAEASAPVRTLLVLIPAYVLLHASSFEVDRWFQAYGAAHFAQPLYVESITLTAAWAPFALAYLLASPRFDQRPLWWFSIGIAGVAAAKLLLADTMLRRFGEAGGMDEAWISIQAFANPTLLAAALLCTVAFVALAALKKQAWVDPDRRQLLESLLPTVAAYMLVHVLSFEVDRWFQGAGAAHFFDPAHAERVSLSVLWACCALACVVIGLTFAIQPLRLFGLFVFAVTAGKVLLRDMAGVAPVYRALSAMGVGVLALAGSFAYQRVRRPDLPKPQGAGTDEMSSREN